MKKFDASIPRWRYWSHKVSNPQTCPKCQSPLEKEFHTYLLLTREGNEIMQFMTGNDGGSFCPNCPVVVLDYDIFSSRIAAAVIPGEGSFSVIGIVDLEAIPEDKKDIPIGEDGNPIPLVKFLNTKESGRSPKKNHTKSRKRRGRSKQQRKQKKKKR